MIAGSCKEGNVSDLLVFSVLSTQLFQNYHLFQQIVYLFHAAKI